MNKKIVAIWNNGTDFCKKLIKKALRPKYLIKKKKNLKHKIYAMLTITFPWQSCKKIS